MEDAHEARPPPCGGEGAHRDPPGQTSADAPSRRAGEVSGPPRRIDLSGDRAEAGLARLVVGIFDLLRQVIEHQALRRVADGSLDDATVERLGQSLMALEERMGRLLEELDAGPEASSSLLDITSLIKEP